MADTPTRVRGDGRIFEHPKSRFWHMAFFVDGKEYRERKRQAETDRGEFAPKGAKLTVGELLELVQLDYEKKRNRSAGNLVWLTKHLLEHFDGRCARAMSLPTRSTPTSSSAGRKAPRTRPSGRRSTSSIAGSSSRSRRGCCRSPPGRSSRTSPSATATPARASCSERRSRRSRRARGAATRVRTLTWRDYDKQENGFRLRREEDKTKKGRLIPMAGELSAIMERRLALRRLDCPFVFHRTGKPIGDIRKTWDNACRQAGLSHRLLHDLRRSGIKHLRNAGVPEQTIMRISGHRTNATFSRYSVFSSDELRDALDRGYTDTGGRIGSDHRRINRVF